MTTYTGWMGGMRFLIKREEPVIKEATDTEPEEKGDPIFHAWIWPGPYIFDLTDDSLRQTKPFHSLRMAKNNVSTGSMRLILHGKKNGRGIKQTAINRHILLPGLCFLYHEKILHYLYYFSRQMFLIP